MTKVVKGRDVQVGQQVKVLGKWFPVTSNAPGVWWDEDGKQQDGRLVTADKVFLLPVGNDQDVEVKEEN